jgi:hypothetical protein
MVDRINDIAWQAHQGSVAAIIQLLNDKLATSGVRTRAIFSDGVLHILCEAASVEQLEQSALVEKIQKILESIAPRNIRRVNINSRIVREEQLLWLEEISRDQDNQLLWSQEIMLEQPNIIKQIINAFAQAQTESGRINLPKTPIARPTAMSNGGKSRVTTKKILIASVGLGSGLFLVWFISQPGNNWRNFVKVNTSPSSSPADFRQAQTGVVNTADDPFVTAVRIANQASAAGKTAINSTQWLELAAQWQKASDLMSRVPPSHSRYQEAQIRTKLYKRYSEAAQEEAEKNKS